MNAELWRLITERLGRLPEAGSTGWIGPIRCPWRKDEHPSLTLHPPDDKGKGGAFRDHATGDKGNLEALAERLGIEKPAPVTFEQWCARREGRFDPQQLREVWGCAPYEHFRPAFSFPTPAGRGRVRAMDGGEMKTWWRTDEKGASDPVYGLDKLRGDGPVYVVNGEPGVWTCYSQGVDAVCTCQAEQKGPTRRQAAALVALNRPIRIVLDLDKAGRNGAAAWLDTLNLLETDDFLALQLPPSLGEKGDVERLWARVRGSSVSLAEALAALPVMEMAGPPAEPLPQPFTSPEPQEAPEPPHPAADEPKDPLWDAAAERAVCGAVLLDPSLLPLLVRVVDSTDFYQPAHRRIWDAFLSLHGRGAAIDTLTTAHELKARRLLVEAGGQKYLDGLRAASPDVGHASQHAAIVRDDALLRAIRDTAEEVGKSCQDAVALAEEGRQVVANRAHARLHEALNMLSRGAAQGGPRGAGQILGEVRAIFDALEAPEPDGHTASTFRFGMPALDARVELPDRDISALGGDPESGKSALVRQWMNYWDQEGLNPGLILVEDNLRHYVLREIASRTGLNGRVVRDVVDRKKDVSTADKTAVTEAVIQWLGGGRKWPKWRYFEGANMYVEQVAMEARRLVALHGCRIIVIETFSRIKLPRWNHAQKLDKVNHNVDVLAGLGPELGCAVLPTVHLSRAHRKENRPPDMSDFRDTGQWENHCRLMLIANKGSIIVAKANHDSSRGIVHMAFDGPTTTWLEAGQGHTQPQGNGHPDPF